MKSMKNGHGVSIFLGQIHQCLYLEVMIVRYVNIVWLYNYLYSVTGKPNYENENKKQYSVH